MGDTLVMENGITFLDISNKIESFGKVLLETARTILSRKGPIEAIKKVHHAQLMKLRNFLGAETNTVSEIEPIPVPVSETVVEMVTETIAAPPIEPVVENNLSKGEVRVYDSLHKKVTAKDTLVEAIRRGLLKVDANPTLGESNSEVEATFERVPEVSEVVADVISEDENTEERTISLGEPSLYSVPEVSDEVGLEQLPQEVQVDSTPIMGTDEDSKDAAEPLLDQTVEAREEIVEMAETVIDTPYVDKPMESTITLDSVTIDKKDEIEEISAAGPKSPTEAGAVIEKIAEMIDSNKSLVAANGQLSQKVEALLISNSKLTEDNERLKYENTGLSRKAQLLDEKLSMLDVDHQKIISEKDAELERMAEIVSKLSPKAEEADIQRQRADDAEAKLNGFVIKLADLARGKSSGYEKAA